MAGFLSADELDCLGLLLEGVTDTDADLRDALSVGAEVGETPRLRQMLADWRDQVAGDAVAAAAGGGDEAASARWGQPLTQIAPDTGRWPWLAAALSPAAVGRLVRVLAGEAQQGDVVAGRVRVSVGYAMVVMVLVGGAFGIARAAFLPEMAAAVAELGRPLPPLLTFAGAGLPAVDATAVPVAVALLVVIGVAGAVGMSWPGWRIWRHPLLPPACLLDLDQARLTMRFLAMLRELLAAGVHWDRAGALALFVCGAIDAMPAAPDGLDSTGPDLGWDETGGLGRGAGPAPGLDPGLPATVAGWLSGGGGHRLLPPARDRVVADSWPWHATREIWLRLLAQREGRARADFILAQHLAWRWIETLSLMLAGFAALLAALAVLGVHYQVIGVFARAF